MLSFRDKPGFDKDAVVVCLTSEQVKANFFPKQIDKLAKEAVLAGQFEGNKGQTFPILIGKRIVVLLGLGKPKDNTLTSLRIQLRAVLLSAYLKKAKSVEVLLNEDVVSVARAAVEAVVIGTYSWKKYIARKKDDTTVEKKDFVIVTKHGKDLAAAVTVAQCANYARDLINENADVTTAVFLEKQVLQLIKGQKNVQLEVLDRKKLQAKKMGLILAVNQGSNKEPRVVVVKYNGGASKAPYTAIVGKGLTFDSGGLNLKPSGSIEDMRCDMSGAAAVWATLKAVLELRPKKNIIFAAGMAENAIDANAYKPGDVITGHAGISVEIGNTDAEGRLVLADVLSYVIKTYKPARIIDLATLTGACRVALGNDHAGLISNNDDLADELLKSAAATDDRAWRLPNYPELHDCMKSKIADLKNTSNLRGAGGTLTGAEFLRRFVGDTPWAHLDIAAVAFSDAGHWYYAPGATGYGVRLLVNHIMNN